MSMRSLDELMDLTGKKAIITGGGGHIGYAAGQALIELGATVTILDLNEPLSRNYAIDLSQMGPGHATALQCDLTDEEATRSAIQDGISEMSGLDILVHCAAFVGTTTFAGWAVPFEHQTVEAWDAAMRVNLTSPFVMVQEGKEALSASSSGSVIFFGSTYGMVGPDLRLYEGTAMANPAGYAASKGGIIQLTRYLATILAPKVRVNSITPGGVWRDQPDSFHKRYVDRTPMKRMAIEEDLKGAVAYLASDMSAYVTGQNLAVDGGWTAW